MALIDRFAGDIDERRMSLGEHLDELRKHVFKAVIWIALALVVCLCFQDKLMEAATYPFHSCMREIAREKQRAYADAKGAKPRVVTMALDELEKREEVDKKAKRLEQNAVILKEKVAENPEGLVEAFTRRRENLETRQRELEQQQEALFAKPEALKIAELDKARLALAADTKAYFDDLRRDVAPLTQGLDERYAQIKPTVLTFPETFMSYLKVAMVCAIFVASPLIARELWKFVSAGLYKDEKKYVTLFAPVTYLVFIIGASFGYFILIPAGLKFLATYGGEAIGTEFRLSDYLSLLLNLTLMVGLIFELPLVMGFLSLLGFTNAQFFRNFRRYWFLIAFILGAIIAPSPDPLNQCMCAIPLVILYEIGILLSAWLGKRRDSPADELPGGATLASMPPAPMPSSPSQPQQTTGAP